MLNTIILTFCLRNLNANIIIKVFLFFSANLQSHPFIEKLGPKTFDHVKYFVVRNTATLSNHEIEHEQVQWAAPHLNYMFATTDIYIYIDTEYLLKLTGIF